MSYGNGNTTVEKYFAQEFPYLLMREQRNRGTKCAEFAAYLGISLESLENYRNGISVPRADTLIKIISKCSVEFLADVIAIAGLHDKYSIVSSGNNRATGISIVASRNNKATGS
jgi:transcriptional regulator with XRE-family HTH domain